MNKNNDIQIDSTTDPVERLLDHSHPYPSTSVDSYSPLSRLDQQIGFRQRLDGGVNDFNSTDLRQPLGVLRKPQKEKMDETHKRQSFHIHKDLIVRLEQLDKHLGGGHKSHLVNLALRQLLEKHLPITKVDERSG